MVDKKLKNTLREYAAAFGIAKKAKYLLIGLACIVVICLFGLTAYFIVGRLNPEAITIQDAQSSLSRGSLLNEGNLKTITDQSVSIHSQQYLGVFTLRKEELSSLVSAGPFKECDSGCENTTWKQLDGTTYPFLEVLRSEEEDKNTICANQIEKRSAKTEISRDICADTKTLQVWYLLNTP